jgi:hypothetical protein
VLVVQQQSWNRMESHHWNGNKHSLVTTACSPDHARIFITDERASNHSASSLNRIVTTP